MSSLSPEALQGFPHEKLAAYTIVLEQEIAMKSLFLAQVRQEWTRRETQGVIPHDQAS